MRPQPFYDEEGGGHANSGGKGAKHARGEWSSGLCDCTGDWCSCLSVWCCGSVTTAQLCTRFFGGPCPPALLCMLIFIFLLAANISYWTNYNSMQTHKYGLQYEDDELQQSYALSLLVCLGSLFTCLTVCQVRIAIRKRDGIPEANCQGCEDCCCACFCVSCTQCLILRHEGMVAGKYSLCSPIGTPLQV